MTAFKQPQNPPFAILLLLVFEVLLMSTIYVPDFFFLLFYVISFCLSVFSDIFIVLFVFIFEQNVIWGTVTLLTIFPRVICEFLIETTKFQPSYFFNETFQHVLSWLGFRSVLIFAKVLTELRCAEKTSMKPVNCFSFPVFHISAENLSFIKIYCCMNSAVKSIPQIYVMTFLALDKNVTKTTALIATGSILLNVILFSFSISISFPIRKTPRVFTTTVCLIFSAINKFMASMCACCVNIALLALLTTSMKYFALLIFLAKTLIWVWPCWRVLKSQPVRLGLASFGTYLVLLTLSMSIIYIHPFEGQGKLYYYFFYLITVVADVSAIYLSTDASLEAITVYYTLRILMIGFLSCFGLLNILHKHKENKCVSIQSIDSRVNTEDLGEKENKMKENEEKKMEDEKVDEEKTEKPKGDENDPELQETHTGNSHDADSRREITPPRRRWFRFSQFRKNFTADASQVNP